MTVWKQTIEYIRESRGATGKGKGIWMLADRIGHFIGGKVVLDGRTVGQVRNPATGEVIADLLAADHDRLDAALAAARDGFMKWSVTPAIERSSRLREAARLIRADVDRLSRVMTLEQGKPLGESAGEWTMCAEALEWAAEECRRIYGRTIPSRHPAVHQRVEKHPVGPTIAFAPWNFPAFSAIQKIAPALAAGCSMILKPASNTPACSVEIAQILNQAGLPDGVLNVVHGRAELISETLIASPIIRKVTLTGSVEVGRVIASLAGRHLKPCTMELGGHAPVLIMPDVDVEQVAAMAVAAKYRNAGQVCTSPTRFIIDSAVYDRFVEAFRDLLRNLRVGNGLDPQTQMGPLASGKQVETTRGLLEDAESRGAKVTYGGVNRGNDADGYFQRPAMVEQPPDDCRVMHEEPFGPVAVMIRSSSLDDALRRANSLPFGLASYCFTHDARTMSRVAEAMEAGMLAFNQFQAGAIEGPFGGVKDSGFGAEGGIEGVGSYLHNKFISVRSPEFRAVL